MPHEDPLPPVWSCLQGKVHFVRQVTAKEYSCSCPRCGDSGHVGSDFPDRCRLFCDDHPTLFCRKCGLIGFPDQFGGNDYPKPSPAEMEQWRQKQVAAEEARKRSAERALTHLRSSHLWEQYHASLDDVARLYWQQRGIPNDWQDFWKLGVNYEYRTGDRVTPSVTIPLFDHDWRILNIKHRLLEPPANTGKYRYEVSGQGQPMFLTNPTVPLSGHAIAIEGEIKAAVTYIRMGDKAACIVGLPGKHPSPEIVAQLAACERVTLVLDPGSEKDVIKLAKEIGVGKCRAVICPQKIDDGILAAKLTPREIKSMLRSATVLSAFVRQ